MSDTANRTAAALDLQAIHQQRRALARIQSRANNLRGLLPQISSLVESVAQAVTNLVDEWDDEAGPWAVRAGQAAAPAAPSLPPAPLAGVELTAGINELSHAELLDRVVHIEGLRDEIAQRFDLVQVNDVGTWLAAIASDAATLVETLSYVTAGNPSLAPAAEALAKLIGLRADAGLHALGEAVLVRGGASDWINNDAQRAALQGLRGDGAAPAVRQEGGAA